MKITERALRRELSPNAENCPGSRSVARSFHGTLAVRELRCILSAAHQSRLDLCMASLLELLTKARTEELSDDDFKTILKTCASLGVLPGWALFACLHGIYGAVIWQAALLAVVAFVFSSIAFLALVILIFRPTIRAGRKRKRAEKEGF